MELILYNYKGDNLTVNKTLENGTSINGNLRESADNENLSIELEYQFENFNFNYCYCVELNRYYFIDSFYLDITNIYTVNLRIDYLKSFENEILNSECEVIECENNYNNDNVSYNENTKQIENIYEIENPFSQDSSIIEVVSKGSFITSSNS